MKVRNLGRKSSRRGHPEAAGLSLPLAKGDGLQTEPGRGTGSCGAGQR